MPFGATFWVDGWEDVMHPHDFPNDSIVLTGSTPTAGWREIQVHSWVTCECIQAPYNGYDGDSVESFNVGRFQGERDSGTTVLPINSVEPVSWGFDSDPNLILVNLTSDDVDEQRWCTYHAPYFKNPSSTGPPDLQFQMWTRGTGSGTQLAWFLHHVQPVAFRGVVSEVIGAILMYAGYDPNRIDQDSFDEAYDAELLAGSDNNKRPYVWVIPQQGESVLATIKRIMQHWNHILTFDRAGKIALVPADSLDTPYVIIDTDSNILELKSKVNKELIFNKVTAMHGGGYMRHAAYVGIGQPSPVARCHYEAHLKSDYDSAFSDEYLDQDSIDKFGERQYGDQIRQPMTMSEREIMVPGRIAEDRPLTRIPRTINVASEGEPVSIAHFPHYHYTDIKDAIMARFLSNETKLKDTVEIKQDLLGFDFDIGHMVLNGQTGLTYRCIKQTLDFNKFTVTSNLLQEFGTEYAYASTVIWEFVNLDDAPVGGTSIWHSGGSTWLSTSLTVTPSDHDWRYRIYISKDGGEWEERTSGWIGNTGSLSVSGSWSGENDEVRVFIRAADDDGLGDPEQPTPMIAMPTATI